MLSQQQEKTGHAELSPLVTLCSRITRPKECRPRRFFILVMPNHFLTHHLRHYVPVLAEVRENLHVFPC